MSLTIAPPVETITPPPITVTPPAITYTPPPVVVTSAQMVTELTSEGYMITPPGTVTPPPPPPPAVTSQVGLWNNGTGAKALGCTPAWYLDYADGNNSTTFTVGEAGGTGGEILVLRVGKLTAAQATQIAQDCKTAGQVNAVIAPMWEYNNHGWFTVWNQTALTIAQFQAEWEIIVNAMRAVCPTLQFALVSTADNNMTSNDAKGRSEFDVFLTGTDALGLPWVNIIGIDVYDNNGSVAASQACISNVSVYAGQHGLQWAIFEWGLYNNVDDPAYVDMIATVTAVAGCLFQALFSESGLKTGSGSDITLAPNSLARYKLHFA